MPITLVTGLPGHGKSLYTVSRIAKRFADRDVYYHNIKDLKLPWLPIPDPDRWFDVPPGSVIVMDECQDIFPTRDGKTPVPEKCKKFEVHRHDGHDIVLITQKPRQLDVHVRQLVGEHIHVERKLGAQKAITYTWPKVCEDVDDEWKRKDSEKAFFPFPKEAYSYYHSAEVHTVKRRIPKWMWLIPASFLLLGFLVYSMLNMYHKFSTPNPASTDIAVPGVVLPGGGILHDPAAKPKLTYITARVPELTGFPETAPAYAELTKPKQAPYPAACVRLRGECKCWTQQATHLDTPKAICEQIVDKGYFLEWQEPERNRGMGQKPHADRYVDRSESGEGQHTFDSPPSRSAPL